MKLSNLDCNLPYCALSDQGKAQCTALGQEIGRRYSGQFGFTDYDVTRMHSVSTSVPRVIESAESMLTGMFPDALPFVDFVPNTEDLQMSHWTSWPSWKMSDGWHRIESRMNDVIHTVANQSTLSRFGQHFGIPNGACDDPNQAAFCASVCSDTFFCRRMQKVGNPQWLEDMLPIMKRMRTVILSYTNAFFPDTDSYEKQIGSYGYPLASAMIRALSDPIDAGHFPWVFHHRGAHDWTLMAFYAAVGFWTPAHNTDPDFAVDFAEAIFIERHSWDSGPDTLLAYRARPSQVYSADYSFGVSVEEIGLLCVDPVSNKTSYTNSTQKGCPIDDVWRAINRTAPLNPMGDCYATEAQLAAHGCTTTAAPDSGSVCAFYRENCPSTPCAGRWDLISDAANGYECVGLSEPEDKSISYTTFGVTGGACAAGGLIVGALAMILNRRRLIRTVTAYSPHEAE